LVTKTLNNNWNAVIRLLFLRFERFLGDCHNNLYCMSMLSLNVASTDSIYMIEAKADGYYQWRGTEGDALELCHTVCFGPLLFLV